MNDIDFIFKYEQTYEPLFDFTHFFEIETTMSERSKQMKAFVAYFAEHGERTQKGKRRIEKQYWCFLCELLSKRIDDARNKITIDNINCFFIDKDEYSNNTIAFFTRDGKYYRLGVTECLKGYQKHVNSVLNHRREAVCSLLRDLIRPQVKQIKDNIVFPVKSELSGEQINDMCNLHIDHYNDDFSKVQFDWLLMMKHAIQNKYHKWIDVCNELYKIVDWDNKRFKNEALNKSWIDYHKSHTHLRVITKQENLKREKHYPNWDLLKINGDKKYETKKKPD